MLLCLSEDQDTILKQSKMIQQVTWPRSYDKTLLDQDYHSDALYDATYETKDGEQDALRFISCISKRAPTPSHRSKMIKVSSREAVRRPTVTVLSSPWRASLYLATSKPLLRTKNRLRLASACYSRLLSCQTLWTSLHPIATLPHT